MGRKQVFSSGRRALLTHRAFRATRLRRSTSRARHLITNPNDSFRESNMSKGQSLQAPYPNILRKERIPVSIFLVNGIKLQGQIESFDQFVILLRNTVSQMVYKHAISTVVPARNVRLPQQNPSASDAEL